MFIPHCVISLPCMRVFSVCASALSTSLWTLELHFISAGGEALGSG